MEDSMIDMPKLEFDEKIGNKRVRDGEEESPKGRLEKRPSGIFGVNGGGDGGDEGGESGGGGIIDTFISNVFHKSESDVKEEENGGQVKTDVIDVEVEDKGDDLGGGGGGGGGGGEGGGGDGEDGDGGGIINAFFSNIFHRNGSADDGGGEGNGEGGGGGGAGGDGGGCGGGEVENLKEEKVAEKKETVVDDLASKDVAGGEKSKMKPDDYSERVFFLNNN